MAGSVTRHASTTAALPFGGPPLSVGLARVASLATIGPTREVIVADVVLVTGVSRYLGGQFARALTQDPTVKRVIGVDVIPPPGDIGRAEFVRADIRNPMIGKIIAQSEVDTVVHMNVIATPTHAGGRTSQKEINVIGTMQLLAACQKAPSIKRLVVKSSAAIYGSSPRDPAMFTEDMGPKSLPRAGFGKDSVEVEGYVRGFSRRRPDVEISMLRFANIIGRGIRTSLTDYFALPVVPVPLRLRRPAAVRARERRHRRRSSSPRPGRAPASPTSPATASSP